MTKKVFLHDLNNGKINTSLMVIKRLYKEGNKVVYLLSDKSGYINGKVPMKVKLEVGQVIEVEGIKDYSLDISKVKILYT